VTAGTGSPGSIGATVSLEPVVFGGSDATVVPDGVTNWTFFNGALSTIVVRDRSASVATGTAVMIAPGLAITASHILRDRLDEVLAGDVALLGVGPTEAGLDLWQIRKLSIAEDDVAYLSLELASEISAAWRFRTIPITTRAPRPGELVHVVGFRLDAVDAKDDGLSLAGDLFAARGKVRATYYPIRDRLLMPYPTIEIACGSLGGMSGGAVLDDSGFLLGVIARGLEAEDGKGPTFAAWVIGAVNRQLDVPWPPGVYEQPVHVLDIDDRLLWVEGRSNVKVLNAQTYTYQVWFDR
jgi:hypothetical protein